MAHNSRLQFNSAGKSQQQDFRADDHIVSIVKKQILKNAPSCLILMPLSLSLAVEMKLNSCRGQAISRNFAACFYVTRKRRKHGIINTLGECCLEKKQDKFSSKRTQITKIKEK